MMRDRDFPDFPGFFWIWSHHLIHTKLLRSLFGVDIYPGKKFGRDYSKIVVSREHAYATTAYLEDVHHYFSTYKIFSHSYQAYTMFVKKKSLFWRISNFLPLPLSTHRPCRPSKPHPDDSPVHAENFKPNYTSLHQLEAEIWPKNMFLTFSATLTLTFDLSHPKVNHFYVGPYGVFPESLNKIGPVVFA